VRLLASAWLALGRGGEVPRLEKHLAEKAPSQLAKNALVFGPARLASGDSDGAEIFFAEMEKKSASSGGGKSGREWISFYRGLSAMTGKKPDGIETAKAEFSTLCRSASDPLVAGLSAWFLAENFVPFFPGDNALSLAAAEGRARAEKMLRNGNAWSRREARSAGEIHVTLLAKYLGETKRWIFGDTSSPGVLPPERAPEEK
jgi:hypothetical protein